MTEDFRNKITTRPQRFLFNFYLKIILENQKRKNPKSVLEKYI